MTGVGDDPYETANKGKLKLKCDSSIKKKKKKSKERKVQEQVRKVVDNSSEEIGVDSGEEREPTLPRQTKTKAELAFLRQQEKMVSS